MPTASKPLSMIPFSIIQCVFAAFLLALAGCSPDQPDGPGVGAGRRVEVGVVTLEPQNVVLQSELAGRTTPSLISDVRPQVSGIIKERLFEEGSRVKAGQALYQIDPSVYESTYREAQADLANAEAAVAAATLKAERYADLLEIDGVSQQEADDARASYQQAVATVALKKAALESARINVQYTTIRAPISGRIGKSSVTAGALVTANQETALATIRALDPIYVDLTQSTAELLRLRKLVGPEEATSASMSVRLKLEDGSEYEQNGTLKFREVAVDEATGSVTLRAQFPNPKGVLLPGMYVRAVLDEAVKSAAMIAPQQSITRDPKGNALAMVVDGNNKVEQRTVVTERVIGKSWLITSGLAAGERVIVEGLNKIRPGDTVEPVALNLDAPESGVRAAGAAAPSSTASTPSRSL